LQPVSLEKVIVRAKKEDIITIDIETTLGTINTRKCIMLQLGTTEWQVAIDTRRINVSRLVEILSKKKVVGHNIKFDIQVLEREYGVKFLHPYDTMLAAKILECGLEPYRGRYALNSVVQRYIDPFAYTNQGNLFLPLITKKVREEFLKITTEDFTLEQIIYGMSDVYYTHALKVVLDKKIAQEELQDVLDFENEVLLVIKDMEVNGMPIDVEKWLSLGDMADKKAEENFKYLSTISSINWDSPKQVKDLFKSLNINVEYSDSKTGRIKEGVGVMTMGKQMSNPIVYAYTQYKKERKKATSFKDKMIELVDPISHRIHPSFDQILATGRISSFNPNMQQIPSDKEYRACFKSNDWIIGADYTSQELFVLADAVKEKKLQDVLYLGGDAHLLTASLVYSEDITNKNDPRRQIGKITNFLTVYGGGAAKLADQFNLPKSEAKRIIDTYYTAYPSLKQKFLEWGDKARETGYVLINPILGRKSYIQEFSKFKQAEAHVNYFKARGWWPIPKIESYYRENFAKIQRLAQNRPIQGTSADITKKAGVLMYKNVNRKFKLLLMVHDEWVIETTTDNIDDSSFLLESSMVQAAEYFGSKIPVTKEINKNWKK
jgi:DNA polymerase-1